MNATRAPSPDTDGPLLPQAIVSSVVIEAISELPLSRCQRITSEPEHEPTASRMIAGVGVGVAAGGGAGGGGVYVKATTEPSAEMAGSDAVPPVGTNPPPGSGSRVVVPSRRS